jgi:hypothetical protein
MSDYRVFLFNDTDCIVDSRVVTCGSDDEASSVAPTYLAGHAAVEVWCERRRLLRIASAQPEARVAPRQQTGLSA